MTRGVIYIATGEDFIGEAESSAEQLNEVMPQLDITIFSDRPPETDVIDNHIPIEDPKYDFIDKISRLRDTPYDRTLYLDSDVYVNEPISEVFDILDDFDMAAALDAHQQPAINNGSHEAPDIYDGRYDPAPEYNTGVLAYRMTDSVEHCFDIWEESYDSENHWAGQPSFIPGYVKSDVRICTLPRRYNFIVGLKNVVSGRVKVFHSRLENGPEPGFKDIHPKYLPELIQRVNARDQTRATYPKYGQLKRPDDLVIAPRSSMKNELIPALREHGVVGTLKRAGAKFLSRL